MKAHSIIFIVAMALANLLFAQEATVWRGGTNGVYSEKGLLKSWPEGGPQVLWTFEGLGAGHSSPVFAHGKIFVSSMIEQTGYIFILTTDGKEEKRYAYGPEFFESFPGTRSTPVIVGDKLYIYSGLGVIYAMDALTGKLLWKKEMLTGDAKNITWGVTETLVIDGDKIFCSPGGATNNIVALNRNNGEIIWTSTGVGDASAYCTPLLLQMEGRKLLVTMMASHIVGLDAATGKMLWNYEQTNKWSVHANTPVHYQGTLLCTSGYGKGSVKLKLSPDGSTATKVWHNEKLDSRHHGTIILDGYVYGSGDSNREWRCVDYASGTEKWASNQIGKGVIIAADNLLFLYSEKGELAMAEASPDAFKLLGQTKVEKGTAQHWAHPVINKGVLYLRHGDALIAYKIK